MRSFISDATIESGVLKKGQRQMVEVCQAYPLYWRPFSRPNVTNKILFLYSNVTSKVLFASGQGFVDQITLLNLRSFHSLYKEILLVILA